MVPVVVSTTNTTSSNGTNTSTLATVVVLEFGTTSRVFRVLVVVVVPPLLLLSSRMRASAHAHNNNIIISCNESVCDPTQNECLSTNNGKQKTATPYEKIRRVIFVRFCPAVKLGREFFDPDQNNSYSYEYYAVIVPVSRQQVVLE